MNSFHFHFIFQTSPTHISYIILLPGFREWMLWLQCAHLDVLFKERRFRMLGFGLLLFLFPLFTVLVFSHFGEPTAFCSFASIMLKIFAYKSLKI